MNNWSQILVLSSLVSIFLLTAIIWEIQDKEIEHVAESAESFCGVSDVFYSEFLENDSINLQIGKNIFKTNCASCHHRNMIDDLTGPPLLGSISRFHNDTVRYMHYVQNAENFLDTTNDNRMISLHETYSFMKKPLYQSLDYNEIRSVIEYIEVITY